MENSEIIKSALVQLRGGVLTHLLIEVIYIIFNKKKEELRETEDSGGGEKLGKVNFLLSLMILVRMRSWRVARK